MWIYCYKLQTKVPGLVRGGGEDITNCDWIDLKSRGSFLSLRRSIGHALEEVEIFEKYVVNDRFFSRLKKINKILYESCKKNV